MWFAHPQRRLFQEKGYPKSRQQHDATINRLESGDETPLTPSIKVLTLRCVVMVIYLLLGALVFKALEECPGEDSLQRERRALLREFNISKSRLQDFEKFVRRYQNKDWDYYESLYFASTVTTTIGYGHITPQTQNGRVFLIIFALIGIPLNILALASVGEHITVAIYHFLRYVSVRCYGNGRINHINIKVMLVSVGLMIFMLFIGGLLYSSTENEWSYIDSVYYCFVAMATIGFGDLVPNRGFAPDSDREKAIWFLRFMFLSIGLSLVSTVFTALSNAMEEINFLVKRNRSKKHFQRKNQSGHRSGKRKYKGGDSEKVSYKHNIKKQGRIVFTFKFLQKLKRKKECDFSHVDWDSLLEEAKRKEMSERSISSNSPLTTPRNVLKKPTILLFTDDQDYLFPQKYQNTDTTWLPGTPEAPETSSSRVTESDSNSPSSVSKAKYTLNSPHPRNFIERPNETYNSRHRIVTEGGQCQTRNERYSSSERSQCSRKNSPAQGTHKVHRVYQMNNFQGYGSIQNTNYAKKLSPPTIWANTPRNDYDEITINQC